ncbi:MAG: DMT family transporter [Pseudomonadota bacterium]
MALINIVGMASLAMLAFAANSLLARLALSQTETDPATFSVIRLVSGAIFLLIFVALRYRRHPFDTGSWRSALALFVYAVAFSYAYISLPTGIGALILFGSVQATMLCYGFTKGERFSALQWSGFALACFGVVYLLSPGATAPALSGTVLMSIAGIAWGVYTLRAGGSDPIKTSASNFARTVPMCLILFVVTLQYTQVDGSGLIYALASGVITSGIGYVIWYTVLPHISVINASTIQLSVPAIAALMGVLILSEPLTLRLVLAALAILVGIAVVLRYKRQTSG